jgi:hypothetical protein
MKTNILKLATILLILTGLLTATGCDDKEKTPHAIVGKWKLIATGGYYDNNDSIVISPVENSPFHLEFFRNGKMRRAGYYSGGEAVELIYPYQIDDLFLYENYTGKLETARMFVDNPICGCMDKLELEKMLIFNYKIDEDTLTLECVWCAIPDIYPYLFIFIYQRINK